MKNIHRIALIGLLFIVAVTANAATFYKLSDLSSSPVNNLSNAPITHVIEDIWIVDDTGYTAPELFRTKLTLEEAREKLIETVTTARRETAMRALTNAPALKPHAPFVATNWLSPEVQDFQTLELIEALRPNFRTNLSPERLKLFTNRDPVIKTPPTRAYQLPDHINRYSPTYEQDLKKWKEENLPAPEPKGNDGSKSS